MPDDAPHPEDAPSLDDGPSPGDDGPGDDPAAAAERYVRTEHGDVLDAIGEAATAVDSGPSSEESPDRPGRAGSVLADAFERALDDRDVLDRLPAVLSGAVAATGRGLSATPVPAPPYVAVTSRGPVLRGTTADGRLVVTLAAFAVEREPRVRYVRVSPTRVRAAFVDG